MSDSIYKKGLKPKFEIWHKGEKTGLIVSANDYLEAKDIACELHYNWKRLELSAICIQAGHVRNVNE